MFSGRFGRLDPYLSEAVGTDQRALVDAKFVGASVDLDYRAGRLDKRCPDDPLNPWVPKPPLGVVGLDGQGLEWIHSLAATDDAIPAGEIPPNALPYDAARNDDGDDVGVRIVGGGLAGAGVPTALGGGRRRRRGRGGLGARVRADGHQRRADR